MDYKKFRSTFLLLLALLTLSSSYAEKKVNNEISEINNDELVVTLVQEGASVPGSREIKILAIGNSFSDDAVEHYLHGIANANDDKVIIGNTVIAGASLEMHYNNSLNNSPSYSYRKINQEGSKTTQANSTLLQGIKDEDWDYISIQQVSQNAGRYETYSPYIEHLVNYIREHATNPNVKLVFHATWAYAEDSNHPGFTHFNNDQITMYNAIVDVTRQVVEKTGIDIIIPAGTAIQNGRTSKLGDSFTRDGFHLETNYGRYTASCVWYEKIFGKSVVGNSYIPNNITDFQAKVAQYAAHHAVEKPYEITSLANLTDDTPRLSLLQKDALHRVFYNQVSFQ